jgi:6-phosphogluconolactonase (cycloisomerase 2 family)
MTPTLAAGLTQQFSATGGYSDGTKKDITTQAAWSSSQPAIASVGATTGLATAVASGTATITATLSGVTGTVTLTVTAAALESVTITPPSPSLPAGVTQQLTATATYSDKSTINVTSMVTWNSSTPTVATVTPAGLVSAVSPGTSTISATYNSTTVTTVVTVTNATVASIAVTPATSTLPVGVQQQLKATATLTDGSHSDVTASATWTAAGTTTPAAATVSTTGLVSAVAAGSSTIAAAVNGVQGTATVTVTSETLASIAITPASISIANTTKTQLHATGTYTDTTVHDITAQVTWTSGQPTIASVSNAPNLEGQVMGLAPGTATITATLSGISSTSSVTVTGATLMGLTISVPDPNIYIAPSLGSTQQATAIGTFSDSTTQDLTTTVTWTSSAPAVATVSNAAGSQGLITGAGAGTSNITADLNMMSTTTPISMRVIAASFMYVASTVAGNVTEYRIAPDGTLTEIGNTSASTTAFPFSIAIDPTNRFAYVANYGATATPTDGNSVSEYGINPDGTLTPIGKVPTGTQPNSVVVDPTGKYVYTANYSNGTAGSVSQFSINADGSLTSLGTDVASGAGAASLAFDPSGTFLYVANYKANNVSQFSIGASGVLTPVNAAVAAGTGPNSIAVDPAGHMFVADDAAPQIAALDVGAGGILTAAATSAYGTGPNPFSVTFDPSHRYVYVANANATPGSLAVAGSPPSTVSQFSIDTNGVLSPLASPTVAAGLTPSFIAVDPTGTFAYVANRGTGTLNDGSGSSLLAYAIGEDGSLTPNAITATTPAGKGSASIAITH